MNWNRHSDIVGTHAFLSASNYHWTNYDENKLMAVYRNFLATQKGTALHELAHGLIKLGVGLPRSKKTLNMFVNDAIGFRMNSEQPLYYSQNCYGTADAISFRKNELRIHDLKTGATPANMRQLEVYAALFCLEYRERPGDIKIELRIYQNDDIIVSEPDTDTIAHIMDTIVSFDKIINQIKEEEGN